MLFYRWVLAAANAHLKTIRVSAPQRGTHPKRNPDHIVGAYLLSNM
jgi:hypothetical protein